ncbi:23S rRNA (pseudouridine(1915)-N(3))-methyltransferase RlmH [Amphiplicatus metriothermophilus]|uniref:Ribosomal RNA large subunit methyltransferase H n=1 Tax=Amphiplicatus metriothermophilus TaxID=1519374 RepID=A0A239PJG6_9PROT|nr:23S rRNA (pseudouridine(1915)-N(3))-methyltransferase RlmH [Amphiplicatus metriothermophilus]MBB5517901.1 23S rRNA (pseudouridine1915-N3)-methyltransferase [Amphiplicatus metriothermophilus]SNT67765.1 23S rRNA (pseudouridine1915-N3)-methyltransferase [Amphiplicatus metriothermophilus]
MRLVVAAIGRAKNAPEAALVDDYAARIRAAGRAVGFSDFAIIESEAPKGLDGPARRTRESALLAAAIPDRARRIVLDERGKPLASADFAALLGRWRDQGAPAAAFLIGGADGHDPSLREKADLVLSFGPATWPHMLVRAMLCEQIYRAMTILSGHPYHRG